MREDEEDRPLDTVAAVMARLAAGDPAALVTLRDRWGGQIKAALRRIARSRNVRLRPDELDDLLLDAVLVLERLAGSWTADGGAMPWVWAERRLANVVDQHLGQLGPSLDDVGELHVAAASPVAWSGPDEDIEVLLARLAQAGSRSGDHHAAVADLQVALHRVASARDRQVFLEVAVQRSMGDPSPANTVAAMFDLKPDAVRKVCSRVRRKLGDYAAEVPESGLADLALVA